MKKLFVTITTVAAMTTMTGCMTAAAGTAASMALPYAESLLTKQMATSNTNNSAALAPTGQSSDLIGTLVQQLGVTPQQAAGGTGSIFSLAQQRMSPDDFTQLSKTVPNMNQYLSAVPAQTAVPNATGNSTLAGSFQNLGLNADMASKFLLII